jgi:glycine cleavage system H protein
MANVPENMKFTREHLWLKDQGEDLWRIGFTDHAQEELGSIIHIDLPALGSIAEGQRIGSVEASKTVAEIYAPADGEVTAVNTELAKDPTAINHSSYENGWIAEIRLKQQPETLTAADYSALIQ